MIRALLALALLCAAPRAGAETLVAELARTQVEIASNFAGDRIAIFGVVERDAQTVSRQGPYQVIIVVRGPAHTVLVQRRERVAGIWVNTDGERFVALPSYYGVFTNVAAEPLLLEGGSARGLSLRAIGGAGPQSRSREEFRAAIARQRTDIGLFTEDTSAVKLMTRTFFRSEIPLPGIVEDGPYEVTVHLYADGVLLDTQDLRFVVAKVGFEQSLFELARNEPLTYGFAVVLLALVTGYVGGVVFRRS